MTSLTTLLSHVLNHPAYVVGLDAVALLVLLAAANRKMLFFVLKSLSRNVLRTTLTPLSGVVLVFVVTHDHQPSRSGLAFFALS